MNTPESLKELPEVEAMRMGIAYRFPISLRAFKMEVRPLTMSETIQVKQEVVRVLGSLPTNQRTPLEEHTLLARETLKLASQSDVGSGDFGITDAMLDNMRPEEIRYLMKEYVKVVDKCDPCFEEMSIEELEELVDYLKKESKKNPLALTEFSFSQLVSVARYLMTKEESREGK